MIIYGISGEKGHGKDTFAKFVQTTDLSTSPNEVITRPWVILHFADDVKKMCMEIFGLSHEDVYTDAGKEAQLQDPIALDRYIQKMSSLTGLPIRNHGKVAFSPRQVLQFFGTEYVRSECDSYWIDLMTKKVEAAGKKFILIPDTRFANEYAAVREWGGTVIKIVRSGMQRDDNSKHASELEQQSLKANITLVFKKDSLDQMKQAAHNACLGALHSLEYWDPYKQFEIAEKLLQARVENILEATGCSANLRVYYDNDGKKRFKFENIGPISEVKPTAEEVKLMHAKLEKIMGPRPADQLSPDYNSPVSTL